MVLGQDQIQNEHGLLKMKEPEILYRYGMVKDNKHEEIYLNHDTRRHFYILNQEKFQQK